MTDTDKKKCRGKVFHLTRESAETHATDLARKVGQVGYSYQCDGCGLWHVGFSTRLRKKMSRKARRIYRRSAVANV
jgi:hypothetical protein